MIVCTAYGSKLAQMQLLSIRCHQTSGILTFAGFAVGQKKQGVGSDQSPAQASSHRSASFTVYVNAGNRHLQHKNKNDPNEIDQIMFAHAA
jgi:hypothetical protein